MLTNKHWNTRRDLVKFISMTRRGVNTSFQRKTATTTDSSQETMQILKLQTAAAKPTQLAANKERWAANSRQPSNNNRPIKGFDIVLILLREFDWWVFVLFVCEHFYNALIVCFLCNEVSRAKWLIFSSFEKEKEKCPHTKWSSQMVGYLNIVHIK